MPVGVNGNIDKLTAEHCIPGLIRFGWRILGGFGVSVTRPRIWSHTASSQAAQVPRIKFIHLQAKMNAREVRKRSKSSMRQDPGV